ncbi:type II toxin-antitoxin system HigA family antitoxin [Vibrio sp. 10N.239.312.D08]|uniref:helix-turn-helix domain-containing protein n=1 Tax=Vibrio sp. 10N.239.312.D08 TaxID=3229978 RepID=UPI00354BFFE3
MNAAKKMNTLCLALKNGSRELIGFNLPIASPEDHDKAQTFIEELMEQGADQSQIELIKFFVRQYQEQNYIELPQLKGVKLLKHLMGRYNIRGSDLPEIGSQPYVSRIIKGKSKLQTHHIERLSKRFKIPKEAFLE